MPPEVKQRLQEMLESTMDQHDKRYAEDTSEIMPMYWLYKGAAIHTMAMVDMPRSGFEKNMLVRQIGQLAEKDQCDGFTFSNEGWTLPAELMHTHTGGYISDRPERIEILNVEAGVSSGYSAILVADMQRHDDRVVLVRREILFAGEDGATYQSRFNIFNPQVPAGYNAVRQPARNAWG